METQFEHTGIPVAIVGMACRIPGADNLDQFWSLLERGGSAIGELPHDRLNQELYYDPRRGQRGKTYSKLGAIISSRQFDHQACPIPPELEKRVDNAHLLMCETAAAACRHAGMDPFNLALRNTGVYIGHAQGSDLAGDFTYGTCIEEAAQFLREVPQFQQMPPAEQEAIVRELVESVRAKTPQRTADSPDVAINMVAGTITKAFGLNGPFMGVNSACASSLQSVMLGARALQLGRIDMAIVGGASDCKSDSLVLFSHAQSMSESGTRPFDASADGLICSEGYVCLVLKTLPRALADGDRVQAIVMGLGMSSDGRGKSLWAPRKEGQVKAMERAYRHGLDMSTLQYIEAHATSTNLGDATELNALTEVLSAKFPPGKKIPITSVKANIGHALEAAGVSSVIKAVLCMQHKTFVPAINIQSLNAKINWETAPFYIPRELTAWPEQPNGLPRRAAVNAFGIGGLNLHIVLEEFNEARRAELTAKYAPRAQQKVVPRAADGEHEAVAVIGMGCFFPGANHPTKFWELLTSGRDPKGTAPAGRWRADLALEPGSKRPYHTPTTLGGYITDFAYDWRRHKEPPKQVQQADPLQFMLLEAADQALIDSGYDKKEFDRTRVGVLVGTEFGGDFSTQLEVGLRLPELEQMLRGSLARRGLSAEQAAQLASGYSETVLKHWPALVDESGSFSTSTLASRITKTMNLMGGAAAIDSSDTSSAAVLSACVDALLSGDCDMMICAGGQRCMNLPQFEGMAATGVLSTSERPPSPFDAAANGIVPGEGVGVLLLKRLSEARRDGDRIHAIIRGVGAAHATTTGASLQLAIERGLETAGVEPDDVAVLEMDGTGLPSSDQEQLRAVMAAYGKGQRSQPLLLSSVTAQIGHTVGASAMASLFKATLEVEHGQVPATFGLTQPLQLINDNPKLLKTSTQSLPIVHTTRDGRRLAAVSSWGKGQAFHIVLERGEKVPVSQPTIAPTAAQKPQAAPRVATAPTATLPLAASAAVSNDVRIFRCGAASAEELAVRLNAASADPAGAFATAATSEFAASDTFRLAIVANGVDALARKLTMAARQYNNADAATVLEQQGCFYRQVPTQRPRVALLFPGQGSQYAGMLRDLVRDVPAAAARMREIDDVMRQHGFQSFAQMAWENPAQLGTDVWVTQIVMLLSDLIVHAAITDLGVQADLVAGHSYGEFAALTAAGVWDLEGVVTAARARFDAIEATPTARGTLLATTAPPALIEQLAATLVERTYIANYNAPDQNVVGGSPQTLKQLADLLGAQGHKAQLLNVPCPYHTPLMAGSGPILKRRLDALRLRTPQVSLLSSVTNRYVAEPEEIRENLAAQLTTPVRYVELVERLADEQSTVFIEVGPQQALTKLTRRILEGRSPAGIVASDNPKLGGTEQLAHVRALLECLGVLGSQPVAAGAPTSAVSTRSVQPVMTKPAKGNITHFDATQRRIEKMRRQATEGGAKGNGHAPASPAHPHANGTNGSNGSNGTHAASPPLGNGEAAGHHAAPTRSAMTEPVALVHAAAPQLTAPQLSAPQVSAPKPAPAPQPVAAQPAPQAAAAPKTAATSALNPAELEKFLVNFVVEQTGYPPEVVELDADLEADLGIDSIKKAQLFGELAEYFDVQPNENMTLDDFPTLRHVMNFLAAAPVKGDLSSGAGVVTPSVALVITSAAPVLSPAAIAPEAAPAPQAAPAGPSLDPAELEKFLVNFVVEQTGYPPEVVELDADLEADLGIDSIKKAQLFGELAEYFDVQPNENMTLDDFPTLRHVLNFLAAAPVKGTLAATSAPANVAAPVAAAAPQPVASVAPAAIAPAAVAPAAMPAPQERPAGPSLDPVELEKFLVNFVVEQTGYPPEVVELDADLEADLGIDSIKKAQLFGELAEYFDVQPNENMTLDDFPTLRHVLNFLAAAPVKGSLAGSDPQTPVAAPVYAAPVSSPPAPAYSAAVAQAAPVAVAAAPQVAPASPSLDPVELEKFLVNFVVEQTGYPPEVVELDADLEADLGIDSIKKAQLFGELAEYFDVQPNENMTLDDFPTLRHVLNFLADTGAKKKLAPDAPAAETPSAPPVVKQPPSVASTAPESANSPAFELGLAHGRANKRSIRHMLRRYADLASPEVDPSSPGAVSEQFTADELEIVRGIAAGVQVPVDTIAAHALELLGDFGVASKQSARPAPAPVNPAPFVPGPSYDLGEETHESSHRFYLRELALPLVDGAPAMPVRNGAALIVGDNPLSDALERQLAGAGVKVCRLKVRETIEETLADFDRIWAQQPTPHVFITTSRDGAAADPLNEPMWNRRWNRVALLPFYLCQRFVQLAGPANLLDRSSIVTVTNMGGNFGFTGKVTAPECGAVTGLMKAIYLEIAIMRNHRNLRAKAIDAPVGEPVDSLAANICRELASKEVDYEVAFVGGERYVQCAYPQPAPASPIAPLRTGGAWVVSGGSRGITAECALELGKRFQLKLHLLGTTPRTPIDPAWRELSAEALKQLRTDVMRQAKAAGRSMEGEWSRIQKNIEIDRVLGTFAAAGVEATYHACDVGDRDSLAAVLDTIRRTSGPIEGILHGAGVERSGGYEKKSRENVDATLRSKVDGALNLARLTAQDPLEWFIGFGSVSGRLGSNGQADYCLASDALAKLAGWYRTQRPGVRAVTFHWHPWDEIGMAARPESAAMLKITDGPSRMPKDEGIRHFLRELYAGAPESEVMITSWEYHGRYYGTEHHPASAGTTAPQFQTPTAQSPAAKPSSPVAAPEPAGNWESLPFTPLVGRHELQMVDAPLPAGSPAEPDWQGPAVILGANASALALGDRLTAAGVAVHMLPVTTSTAESMAAIEAIYSAHKPKYLFLMSSRDDAAPAIGDRAAWQRRRVLGLNVPFLTAQHWFRLRIKAKDKTPVTVVAATSLGGDFGLSHQVVHADGGALTGMLKAIYVEDTRNAVSEVRVKAIDAPANEPPAALAEAIVRELAASDPNIEVAYRGGSRSVLRSNPRPVESLPKRSAPRGGTWVVTGGARGITAAVAFELGKRFGMKLHLVGRSPAPCEDSQWRGASDELLTEIKAQIVRQAVAEGRSPEKEWERIKNDIEIHDTLKKFAAAGIQTTYHACDLADWDQVAKVLDDVRRQDGPITGIVHGAGWANSGRFGLRNPDYFERTVGGKLDGAAALMTLTEQDPVRYFIGFGSIGGRFGANGLSDYSAANEMLAKLCDAYQARRPDTAVCCFHWQSWDEVGMAMLGDSAVGTKGILKMAFIPPREGVEHLCRELEAGLPTSEVLISDLFFQRQFYPFLEEVTQPSEPAAKSGVLLPLVEKITSTAAGCTSEIRFDPNADPFLLHHQFRGRPLLPAVIGLESVAETARLHTGKPVRVIRNVELVDGLLFHTERVLDVRVRGTAQPDGTLTCELLSDFYNRKGKLMRKDRVHLRAVAEVADAAPTLDLPMPEPVTEFHAFEFQNTGPLYHGPTLHGVKGTTFDAAGGWGQLVALPMSDLGGKRPGRDWIVPGTLLDAGFYVCGIHAWFNANQAFSLPAGIEAVFLGRTPRDHEKCLLAFVCREINPKQAIYDFTVFGDDRQAVLHVQGHRIAMVRS